MVKNRILFVEDDADAVIWIEEYLKELRYEITTVDTVTDAIAYISQHHYDIVLLDLNLPDFLGYEVLKFVNKQHTDLPVIVISAYADMKNKLHAFHLGASDYMIKPINLEELEARIIVHTKNSLKDANQEQIGSKIAFLDNKMFFNNLPLKLTRTEFEILKTFMKNKNSTLTREELCENLSSISSRRSLDYHITNLRKKIGDSIVAPRYIITEYGVGYKYVE